jgi:hypothetical protein
MTGWLRILGMAMVAVLASADAALASGAQKAAPSGTMQKAAPGGATQQKATSGAARAIRVEAHGLTLTPAQPVAGDVVTVKFTVKNVGGGTVAKVPWSIHDYTSNQTLAQGDKTNVAAGASFEVTAQWTAKVGAQKLQGYVDPTGGVLQNTAPVAMQIKELNLTVAGVGDLETTAFSVTPNDFYEPKKWEQNSWVGTAMPMALAATVKNKGSAATTNVAWKIEVRRPGVSPWAIGSGTINRIEPGATANVTASYPYIFWSNSAGATDYPFVLAVESPDEPAARKGPENSRTVNVKVRETKIATRWLTMSLVNGKGGVSLSTDTTGGQCSRNSSASGGDTPEFKLDCKERVTGGKLWAEYLSGVQLKNGWTVTFTSLQTGADPSNWQFNDKATGTWENRPSGSSAHVKVRLAVDAGGWVTARPSVRIEGPEHADPF